MNSAGVGRAHFLEGPILPALKRLFPDTVILTDGGWLLTICGGGGRVAFLDTTPFARDETQPQCRDLADHGFHVAMPDGAREAIAFLASVGILSGEIPQTQTIHATHHVRKPAAIVDGVRNMAVGDPFYLRGANGGCRLAGVEQVLGGGSSLGAPEPYLNVTFGLVRCPPPIQAKSE